MIKQFLLLIFLLSLTAKAEVVGHGNYTAAGEEHGAFIQNGRLHYFNMVTGTSTDTGIDVYNFRVETDGETIVFLQSERNIGEDRTGDGDRLDQVLSYYKISTGDVVYTEHQVHRNSGSLDSYSVHGNFITFTQKEYQFGEDVNQDGDQWDRVIRYLDARDGSVFTTPIISLYAKVKDGVIVSRVSEANSTDYNQDGDTQDNVIVTYNINTEILTPIFSTPHFNLSHVSAYPTVDNGNVVWSSPETHLNQDVNSDGRLSSSINGIMSYDLLNQSLSYTGINGLGPVELNGNTLTYKTYEYFLESDINQDGDVMGDAVTVMHNLTSHQEEYFPGSGVYSLGGLALVSHQYDFEARQWNVNMNATYNERPCSIVCNINEVIQYIDQMQVLSDEQRSHINQNLELTKTFLDGSMHGYIQAIEIMDNIINNIWIMNSPNHVKHNLVEDYLRPIKDELHNLYEIEANDVEEIEQNPDELNFETALLELSILSNEDSLIQNEVNNIIQLAHGTTDFESITGQVQIHLNNILNYVSENQLIENQNQIVNIVQNLVNQIN